VYNGEIYNYRELRSELVEKGCHFHTQSDTEVILKLYETQGIASFARLNGIFAFAILDERDGRQKLVLARDHFGIKPLHYWSKDGEFVFASEQKAILLHLPVVPASLLPTGWAAGRTYCRGNGTMDGETGEGHGLKHNSRIFFN
jgi:asparagine synthetase B (glutamine-hydrolysing)